MSYTGFEAYSLAELEREIEAGICIEFPVIVEMLKRIDELIPIAEVIAENGIDSSELKEYVKAVINLEVDTGSSPTEFKELLEEKDREIENLTDALIAAQDEIKNLERIEL